MCQYQCLSLTWETPADEDPFLLWLIERHKSNVIIYLSCVSDWFSGLSQILFFYFYSPLKSLRLFSTFMAVDWRWTLACVTNNMVRWAQLNWETVLDDEFCAALHWNVLKRRRGFTSYNTVTVYLSRQSCSGTLFSPQKHCCCVLWGFSLRLCGFFLFPLYFLSFLFVGIFLRCSMFDLSGPACFWLLWSKYQWVMLHCLRSHLWVMSTDRLNSYKI